MNNNKLPIILFCIFVVFWIVLAIDPLFRHVWILENIVIFLFAPIVVWSYFKFRLSNFSYILIFLLSILHVLGSHYTYGATPWGDWLSQFFGWERNHYDRIVHFLYGMFMAGIFVDLFKKYLPKNRFMGLLFVFCLVFSIGSLYEVSEFIAGVIVEPEPGLAFLGFQGDIWDTQKDMLLQAIGAILGLFLISTFLPKRNQRV